MKNVQYYYDQLDEVLDYRKASKVMDEAYNDFSKIINPVKETLNYHMEKGALTSEMLIDGEQNFMNLLMLLVVY